MRERKRKGAFNGYVDVDQKELGEFEDDDEE